MVKRKWIMALAAGLLGFSAAGIESLSEESFVDTRLYASDEKAGDRYVDTRFFAAESSAGNQTWVLDTLTPHGTQVILF